MEVPEDHSKVAKPPFWSTGNGGQVRACKEIWVVRHVCPWVCDHDRELTRKPMESIASVSCGEPRVAGGQQGQQSEKAKQEACQDTLTPASTFRSLLMHLTTMTFRQGWLLFHFSLPCVTTNFDFCQLCLGGIQERNLRRCSCSLAKLTRGVGGGEENRLFKFKFL